MKKKNNIFVNFENVTLDIKNLTNEPRFFKKNKTENLISKALLNNINLKINYGDKIGIIGPNGSGKSTFLRLVAQIYKPTSGLLETRGNCIGYFGDIFLNDYENNRLVRLSEFSQGRSVSQGRSLKMTRYR
jgi:ABC-type polysaccharide/polyol phosphate transport system ATPase subunit